MTQRIRITVLMTVLLLQACATNTVSQRYPGPVTQRVPPRPSAERQPARPAPLPPGTPSMPAPPSEPARAADSPAVVALLDRAEQQHQGRDLEAAAVSLERALRIEPRNPTLWQRMATVRLEQGEWDQAIQMAARSNSYAGRYGGLRARNWQIIAEARRAQGDDQGAADAELKARQLE
ncbi:MAG: tetratricopeptide repeat protein [Gammaproteobacteria bacterium]|nr:tetratricopeptide repeat protein [Gammaproteobacteria bacterium]